MDENLLNSYSVDNLKLHFNYDFTMEAPNRRYTCCIIETLNHNFYSGIAMRHPEEMSNTKTGMRIALQRACKSKCNDNWYSEYKHLWSSLRKQWWEEQNKKGE